MLWDLYSKITFSGQGESGEHCQRGWCCCRQLHQGCAAALIFFWLVHCLCDHADWARDIVLSHLYIYIPCYLFSLKHQCDLWFGKQSLEWCRWWHGIKTTWNWKRKFYQSRPYGAWELITKAFRSLDMEALYHQTNDLLSQTQDSYVRLEQVCLISKLLTKQ